MVHPAEMLERANLLRNAPTPFEKIIWKHISRSQLGGHKFRRQHVIGDFIVDFFCPAKGLIVEIDGDTHDNDRDMRRDAKLQSLGYQVMRFTNYDVGTNVDGVLERISNRLSTLADRWPGPGPTPTRPTSMDRLGDGPAWRPLKGRGFS